MEEEHYREVPLFNLSIIEEGITSVYLLSTELCYGDRSSFIFSTDTNKLLIDDVDVPNDYFKEVYNRLIYDKSMTLKKFMERAMEAAGYAAEFEEELKHNQTELKP